MFVTNLVFPRGGERSVNTLSGGELFLASLALAFGLADTVQSYAGGIRAGWWASSATIRCGIWKRSSKTSPRTICICPTAICSYSTRWWPSTISATKPSSSSTSIRTGISTRSTPPAKPADESFFAVGAAWVLVIIIGFILGLQLIKLFLEIGERYAIVAVLTLLAPLGLAMGGSKSTKEICAAVVLTHMPMLKPSVMPAKVSDGSLR